MKENLSSFEVAPRGARWPSGDYSEAALLDLRREDIEQRLGVSLISGEEEGLGVWVAVGGTLGSGIQIELIEYSGQPVKGFALHVDSGCNPEAALEEVLSLLGADADSVLWRKSDISL